MTMTAWRPRGARNVSRIPGGAGLPLGWVQWRKKTWELKVRLSWETILQLDRTWIFYDTTGVCWLVETTVMNFGKQH